METTVAMSAREALAALVSPEGRTDPYPLYERLRAHGDLVEVKPGLYAAVGYAACDRALRDPRLRVQDAEGYDRAAPGWRAHSSLRGYADSMLYRNEPDHARMRRLVSRGFTASRVAGMRTGIAEMTDRLLDGMAELGGDGSPVDFVAEFASRLPIAVISALLGVPESDHVWFREIAADLTLALEGFTSDGLAPADRAMDDLAAYFVELMDRRRGSDDVLSTLAHVRDADRLTGDELVGNMMLLLTAGFETTTFLLGHALLLAFEHPEHAARLRADDAFAPGYVEEVLRFEAPVQATSRLVAEDSELFGRTIPGGSKILVILGAGNRDPKRYADPGLFDPERTDVQPLSFGAGAHFCLGSPLSRLEASIALPRLLQRFPGLAQAGQYTRRETWVGRGLDTFPVTIV
ncbi:cytochrome P450 [Actinocorallia sp. A-T 12471]|uniref:cytochrome P450 n=1 Tax=Actinocorallia sp. A-T 12471 TaxID=3089813 RepID=UPI0029CF7E0A|nr:cytochrome P450 [Actinocorallia sp. A-T 12471]MDX6741592.1 cytochrome P450 [Actinocorallia sp. A-T 12471]